MKLKDEYILHTQGEETLLVPTADADFNGIIRGNKTFNTILQCLLEDTTQDDILIALKEKYDGDEDAMRADIADVIGKLRSIGALED